MAGNTPLYKAFLGIIPTVKGFTKDLESQLTQSSGLKSAATNVGNSTGRTLGESMTNSFKGALKVVGVVSSLIGGLAVSGGISRQLNIEDATKKMEALGYSTEEVKLSMNDALASVKGTAYGLDEASKVASGAMAAGVKPGQDLQRHLGLIADSATIAGVSMDEMGFVMNKVQTGQVAYTEDLNMLADRGIPIFQWLQEEYGVTAVELKDMVSKGKIDSETYFRVMEKNIGGAALKSGETTRGAFKNMLSALSRVGANLTSGFFPLIRQAFVGITAIFDAIGPKISDALTPVWEVIAPLFGGAIDGMSSSIVAWIENLNIAPYAQAFADSLSRVITSISAGVAALKSGAFTGDVVTAMGLDPDSGIGAALNTALRSYNAFVNSWKYNDGEVENTGLVGFMERLGYTAHQLWEVIQGADYSSFGNFISSLSGIKIDLSGFKEAGGEALGGIGAGLSQIAEASPTLLASGLQVLGSALQFLADHMGILAPFIPYVVAGFAAWRIQTALTANAQAKGLLVQQRMMPITALNSALVLANTIALRLNKGAEESSTLARDKATLATIRATAAEKLRAAATKAGAIVTKLAAVAVRGLGIALKVATGPIGWIIAAIGLLGTGLYLFFTRTETGKKIWAAVWESIKSVAASVASWFMGTVVPLLKTAWEGIAAGAIWLYQAVILPVWNGILSAISAVAGWVTGTLVPAFKTAWQMIADGALWLYNNVIQPVWYGIRFVFAIVVAIIMTYIQLLVWYWKNILGPVFVWLYQNVILPVWGAIKAVIAGAIDVILSVVDSLVQFWNNVLAPIFMWLYTSIILPAWEGIKSAISSAVTAVIGYAQMMVAIWQNLIAPTLMWLYQNVVLPVWAAIQAAISAVVSWLMNVAWPFIKLVISYIQTGFQIMMLGLQIIWNTIKDRVINPVISWLVNTVWPMTSDFIERFKRGFSILMTTLQDIWARIKDVIINPVVNWLTGTVMPAITRLTDGIKSAFTKMEEGVKAAWDGIKEKAKAPIKFVVDTVLNGGLIANFNKVAEKVGVKPLPEIKISGFRRGGILPGFSREAHGDDQLIAARRGEGMLVSEALRDSASRALFLAANAAGRRGVPFAKFVGGGAIQGFKKGGIVDKITDMAGDTWDGIKDLSSLAAELITNPKKMLDDLIRGVASRIPEAGLIGEAAKAVPGKIIDGLASKITGAASTADGAGASAASIPGGPTLAGGSLGMAQNIARNFGLRMTSSRRGGARTAGSGAVSLHALSRAMDFSNGSGPTAQMMGFFNAMHPFKPLELLYSPAGPRQWRRSGRMADTSGITKAMHYNHVHVGFKKGGIVGMPQWAPRLMDTGGYLMPGVNTILNKTGGMETVIPRAESEFLRRMATKGVPSSGGETFIFAPQQTDLDAQTSKRVHREFEDFRHDLSFRRK